MLQCLATLVVNVPYHRLQPGLLSRVVKQIRHFLAHKGVKTKCEKDVIRMYYNYYLLQLLLIFVRQIS